MSSDEALHKNNVTTETENSESASSPETEHPQSDNPPDGSAPEAPQEQAESPPPESPPPEAAPPGEQPDTAAESQPTASEDPAPPATEDPPPPASEPPAPAEPVSAAGESEPPPETDTPPAAETPQPGSASASDAPQTPETEPRSRPQLNPTVDPNAAKPVPTLDSPSGPPPPTAPSAETPESESPSENAQESQPATSQPATPPPSAEAIPKSLPAEIPKTADLDADLEAQIASAQASDEASGSQPVPPAQPPAAEGTESEARPAKPQAPPAPTSEEELEPGHKLPGKVQSVSGDDVFFDVGFRSPALVSIRQFDPEKQPEVGQTFHIVVDKVNAAEGLIYANLPRGKRKIQGNWDAVAVGQVVDCMVTKTNKGGLEITVSSLRGFLPASQVDLYYVPDLQKYVGEKLTVKITEANRAKRNLIVSRRQYLQEEREAQAQEIWKNLEVGQPRQGVVKTIKDYGAFIDIGGVDGFLHIGEISWSRIRHPSDVLSEGQEIDVQILSLDEDRQRIGLGMRQLAQNPWDSATQKYAPSSTVNGRVTRTTDFGAFVELEPGVEGLVHISELDYRRVNKVTDVLNVGDETELHVLDLDLGRKRISLSLKALKEKPPELDKKPEKKSDEDQAPGGGEAYNRKRKGPLKGGTGGSGGGGLFGNPGDFTGSS